MKVLFVVIEYDSTDQTNDLMESICQAKSHFESQLSVEIEELDRRNDVFSLDVIIVNNFVNEKLERRDFFIDPFIKLEVINAEENNGYFGGVELVQEWLAEEQGYDYLIYSNPDLTVSRNFFESLSRIDNTQSVSVIGPRVVDVRTKINQNPMYVDEPSKSKFYFLKSVFSNQISFVFYNLLSQAKNYLMAFRSSREPTSAIEIFAPHGSLMIFCSQDFFRRLPKHFCFLYGEELLVAKESQKQGFSIIYDNSIEVYHQPHTTLNKIPSSRLRGFYLEMVDSYIRRYISG